MNEKTLRVLEYDKIIGKLCEECCSVLTRDEARALKPMTDARLIRDELSATDEAVTVLLKKGAPPLGNFYDISGLVHLAAKDGSLTPKQLLEVGYNLHSARRTAEYLSSDLPELVTIDGLASAISVLKGLENEIERCIISEDEIADSASSELARIRRAILRQNEAIRSKINQIVNSSDNQAFLQDAIVTMRQGRYVIPVKAEHKSRLSGIVHDQSGSGATLFVEPQAIVDMNNELRQLELAEKQEVIRILKELSEEVGREEVKIVANQKILQRLDFLFAKGRLACNMKAAKPEINEDGLVNLRKARHPLIDQKKVVPIDVAIGGDYDTLVITGPNTGGKTVTLKTVGLLCLMAQSGMFVPANDGTTVCIFNNVFADIGDEQSIEQSLSTFSSHMVNIVKICQGAGVGSLVLTDELGAGTDPTEGAALAMAVLEHLKDAGAKTVATTHYTELKKYAISSPGVQNASMEFNVETLSPTYHLTIGIPGKSNAFEISSKLGLPEDIIGHARNLLESGDIAFEDVISSIEEDKKASALERRQADELMAEMKKQKARMDALEAKMAEKKEKYIEEAKEEAKELVEEARAEVAQIMKDITDAREIADSEAERLLQQTVSEGRRKLTEDKKKYEPRIKKQEAKPAEKVDPNKIEIGRRVNVLSVGQKGSVISLPDENGNMQVQIGQMKLSVNISGVTLVQENVTAKQREKQKYSRLYAAKSMSVPTSINVVGKNLDDALIEVDKYIDDAFMAGLEFVTIIHGRGAGILRSGIQNFLRHNKNVASFRKGGQGEGGDGATIVTMKK